MFFRERITDTCEKKEKTERDRLFDELFRCRIGSDRYNQLLERINELDNNSKI